MCAAAGKFGDFFLLWPADLNTTHWGERGSGRQVFLCWLHAGGKLTSKCMVDVSSLRVILGIELDRSSAELRNGSNGKNKEVLLCAPAELCSL